VRIVDLLERDATLYPDKVAVAMVGDRLLTYRELRRRVGSIASGLSAHGVGRGGRVALMADNSLVYFDVLLACAYLGATAVPLNTHLAQPEVAYQVDHADPVLCVADRSHGAALGTATAVPVIEADTASYRALIEASEEPGLADRARPDDVALMIYTSGTTGNPKGVRLTQSALTFNAVTIALSQSMGHSEVFLTTTPLYHTATGTRVTTMLLDGQTHVVLPSFDVEELVEAVADFAVTATVLVPTQLQRLLDSPHLDEGRLKSLRLLIYGAAPTAVPVIRRALEALPCGFYQGYGLTEACTNLTGLTPADHRSAMSDELLQSCGRPVVGVELAVCDDAGQAVPDGAVGEIRVRTEKVMTGYWRDETSTAAALAGGWLRTGDLARRDEHGYLYIVGREKDMLISGGVNIYPSEIESVLYQHPAVQEVAVVGIADDEWGEVPAAFMIVQQPVHDTELETFCRERLAKLKVPRRFQQVNQLPRTPTGKVKKFELRQLLRPD
jgi:O-succinylbenzoate-CoA ligase